MRTRITDLFGIEHPILCSGMSFVAVPQLVAAVSQAGGLGILASAPLSPAVTRNSIRRIRELTERPFGINITLQAPHTAENLRVAIEERTPVVNFSLGYHREAVEAIHGYGGKVVNTITTEKHARAAGKTGADALIVTGHEAAAHGGAVTSLTLIPTIRDAVDLPIIAAGGFADGRGLVAALALGADAIAMGTRFATSRESPVHANTKQAIVEKTALDTLYSDKYDGMPCRVIDGPAARQRARRALSPARTIVYAMQAARDQGMSVTQMLAQTMRRPSAFVALAQSGAFSAEAKLAIEQGDLVSGISPIGQSQGLVREVLSVAEIFERVLRQAHEVRARLAG
jgi:enoyl-[acyl-carrier protein] reductase II